MIYVVQAQPTRYVVDRAGYLAPTRRHDEDHTDQEFIWPERSKDLYHLGIDDLCEV